MFPKPRFGFSFICPAATLKMRARQIFRSQIAAFFLAAAAFCFFSAGCLSADEIDLQQVVASLSERYQQLSSFSADYTRTTIAPSTDAVFKNQASHTAKGVLQWKKMTMLRLDQGSPSKELLVTDGQTVWWHIPEEKQVFLYRDVDLAGQLGPLLNFLSGLEALTDSYDVLPVLDEEQREDQIGLVLEAKQGEDKATGKMIIYCDSKFSLTGFRLSSLTGEKTDFYLSNIKINPRFKDEFFVFKVPKGTTVVEETEG